MNRRFYQRVDAHPHFITLCLAALAAIGLFAPVTARAQVSVLPGWDLLQTVQPTNFLGVPFDGVPLGSFNFPGVGVRSTGTADTIVQRLQTASVATTPATAPPINAE